MHLSVRQLMNWPVHQSCLLEERKNLLLNLDPWKSLGFAVWLSVEVSFRSCLGSCKTREPFLARSLTTWECYIKSILKKHHSVVVLRGDVWMSDWYRLHLWSKGSPWLEHSADDHWDWLQFLVLSNSSELWRKFSRFFVLHLFSLHESSNAALQNAKMINAKNCTEIGFHVDLGGERTFPNQAENLM